MARRNLTLSPENEVDILKLFSESEGDRQK